jgi:rhamnose transport system substrate-binding protein
MLTYARFRRQPAAIVIVFLMALVASACSGPGTGSGETGTVAEGTEGVPAPGDAGAAGGATEEATASDFGETGGEGDGDYRLGMVTQIQGIPYYDGFERGAQEAAEEFGVEYTQVGPAQADVEDQLRLFEDLVTQGYDAIAISPLDPTSIASAIAEARDQGVLVVTSDADAENTEREFYVAQATNQALGYTLIDDLARQIDESGQIGIVSGSPDIASMASWVSFMQERVAEEYPDIEIVGGVRHADDSEAALQEAQNLMTAHPDIEGIVGVPSTAVPGVAQAVQNAGQAGEIAVIGYGSPNTARQYIDSGVMDTTVLWDVPELGYLTVWAMQHILSGGELQEQMEVPGIDQTIEYRPEEETIVLDEPSIFDESNVDDFDF